MSHWSKCSVPSCLRPAAALRLCRAHYERLYKTGSLKLSQPILALNKRKNRGSIARILAHVRP